MPTDGALGGVCQSSPPQVRRPCAHRAWCRTRRAGVEGRRSPGAATRV